MPLRIGFVGAGANTRERHIPGFAAIEGVELAGVANRTRESSERVASEFGIARVFDSPEALIADPQIDAVCIGTWPYMHREYTIRALEAGKHVLCEARMAATLEEAEDMLAAHERHPEFAAQLVPAPFDFRLGPTITRLIREGAIGPVREVNIASQNGSALNPQTPIHWRQQMQYSGRNISTLGIWSEVILRWIGDAKRLTASGRVFIRERPGSDGGTATVDIPDTVTVTGELANGAHFTYRVSSVAAGAPDNGINIFGATGTIRWLPGDTATMARHGEPFTPIDPDPGTDRGWRVEADFVDSVRNGTPIRLTSFEDGVRYMRFVDAAWRSINEGRTIEINP
ncbi:MAG: Gfo/Idh/MocA family oxidoreductase [Dehalococcoidia bacterium]|nr:Gfo/Idh/MocA family oxidoreductase [Dehalococcoidia bacterium]